MRRLTSKKCKYCGTVFDGAYNWSLYCSKSCGVKQRRINAKLELEKQGSTIKKTWYSEISEIATKARQHGLSYGEYCARFNVR